MGGGNNRLTNHFRILEISGSQGSFSQGPESSAGSSADSGSGWDAVDSPCDISLVERLIRSHPVWFLPGIQRAGAFHLLQGKEEGNFVVRQSSQAATMAISVRLPPLKGPYIEHYLVQANENGQLSLESSDNRFDSIPQLIAHYCQCCDELPVQLTLPRAIREARNRQQLTSLALLGQEFWRYPMANPRPPDQAASNNTADSQGITLRSSGSNSQASSLSSLGSGNNNMAGTPLDLDGAGDSIVLSLAPLAYSPADSQPPSLMSTFGKGSCHGGSAGSAPSSVAPSEGIASPTSPTGMGPAPGLGASTAATSTATSTTTTAAFSRAQRPTPPNTLNLVTNTATPTAATTLCSAQGTCSSLRVKEGPRSTSASPAQNSVQTPSSLRTPPPPPPRWAKPSLALSQTTPTASEGHDTSPPPNLESKRPSLESDGLHTLSSHSSVSNLTESLSISQSISLGQQAQPQQPHQPRSQSASATASQVTSPTASTPSASESLSKSIGRGSRRHHRTRKESNHYQESDILESPPIYYHTLADKQSDYEDIWVQEMSTFKPAGSAGSAQGSAGRPPSRTSPFSSPERQPDLLERVGTPIVPEPSHSLLQQRNRLGLALNTNVSQSCGNLTPTNGHPLTPDTRSPLLDASTPSNGSGHVGNAKQGSPFYAEPADAIKQAAGLVARRRQRPPGYPQASRAQRHSDPSMFHQWPAATGGRILERIDSSEELANMSSSADNLALLRNSRSSSSIATSVMINNNINNNNCNNNNNNNVNNRPRAKPVQPPRIRSGKASDNSWAVDSSWEFIGNDDDSEPSRDRERDRDNESDRRFPEQHADEEQGVQGGPGGAGVTVHDMILQRMPELRMLPEVVPRGHSQDRNGNGSECGRDREGSTVSTGSARSTTRMSSYDNVEGQGHGRGHSGSHHASDNEDALTEFSEPWDTSRWTNLLRRSETPDTTATRLSSCAPEDADEDSEAATALDEPPRHPGIPSAALMRQQAGVGAGRTAFVTRNKSFRERLDPLLSPPRLHALRSRDTAGPGASIRAYALHLAADKSTTFAQNVDNFIACTKESRETRPQVVMRNMRQFMSGMKNYLVKHGEREFDGQVEKERGKLKANEFLNLDAILEGVMHKLVVRPLKEHLYKLFVEEYTRSGAIQLLAENIQYARTKPLHELGIRSKIIPPTEKSLETICHFLRRLQEVDSPLEKLENLLTCISAIFNSVKSSNAGRGCVTLGADDFLPLFVWVLVQSGMMGAEIEAEYMWGLLHPSLLSGEGGYYLTTLSSAVHVLKNFRACSEEQSRSLGIGHSLDWGSGALTEFRSVLKIVVPDELHGSIITKTLPVRPNMTTREVCKIIAHKARITNPQDYGLFKLVDGEETLLTEAECPQDVKGGVSQAGKHCMFAYKRIDAKIAWPRTASPMQ
ncbi:hypothetical protein ONE63_007104 [Megalurothrips usitatus]|uniref:Protein sprint n=1 Tax=Megalurothrips usitatus TaxID=439358 RepID=A0AAV7XXD0_9NEOP|nr:hypothetical protein ONE63_007104 [Megalurothrips usitatus]